MPARRRTSRERGSFNLIIAEVGRNWAFSRRQLFALEEF